jgi:hypothetical protein
MVSEFPNVAYNTTDSRTVKLELTVAELQNLQHFHAQRQSRSDDNCVEAHIGYTAERKLAGALASVQSPRTPSNDLARW